MNAFDILLVEDNKRDAELIAEALKETAVPHRLILASDGEEALRILGVRNDQSLNCCCNLTSLSCSNSRSPSCPLFKRPMSQDPACHLVLLDLNLPKVSGIEVLQRIRRDPVLRTMPVIILTNSMSQEDVDTCYANFCNAYVRKPLGFDKITDLLTATSNFWFRVVTLPRSIQALPPTSLPPSSDS